MSVLHAPTRPEVAVRHDDQRLQAFAVGCALVAAGIHGAVTPGHLVEAPLAGWFFLVLTVLQTALAVALLRPVSVAVLLTAILGHVGVVMLYVASRTVDLAFLPTHGGDHLPVAGGVGNGNPVYPGAHMEPVGVLDLACLGAELALIALLAALLPHRLRARVTTAMAVLAAAGLVARGAGLLA